MCSRIVLPGTIPIEKYYMKYSINICKREREGGGMKRKRERQR